ncbi:type I DNA topoisomerase [Thermodesulfitimonas autotrophica]|uniref:type I DNA topoisomerase n=1 Tax=Thermodesulfitimonas autotrophica TaxID=1894989 RepID=UPI003FCE9FEC
MMKTLVIVESPAKARTLAKFLGKSYTVRASMGHVRDLPKSELGVDVERGFQPKYITIRGKGAMIRELKSAMSQSDVVLLASDPDREGEAIAWHICQLLNIPPEAPCRIEFNEITKAAVTEALKKPRPINIHQVNAQQARRVLDRLVGYNLSPLLWRKVRRGLSAGRVQSVALRLICDREKEIEAFVPEEYWTLTARLQKEGYPPFEARLMKMGEEKVALRSEGDVQAVLAALKGQPFTVYQIGRQEKIKRPPLPFTTSTLQQEANKRFGFTPQRTMLIAQQLYEGIELGKEGPVGLVTYIRTDSVRVATAAAQEAAQYITARFGREYAGGGKERTGPPKGTRIQDAHEAIRPTAVAREPEAIKKYLTEEQFKLYGLIWERFVASEMAPAVFDVTRVDIGAGDYLFRATGAVLRFAGFLQLVGETPEEEELGVALPELVEGERLSLVELVPKQHWTQPPPRYTEASLVRALEENGVGRPSTYAPTIETIIKRGYVSRKGRVLRPTELGKTVVELLKAYFPGIIDIQFTAMMEEKLDAIEEGKADWVKLLEDFYEPFQEELRKADIEVERIKVAEEVSGEVCERCGRSMVVKQGRYGKFLACPGFPECRNTRPLRTGTGIPCPECGAELVLRHTKKGRPFYGCSRYPECAFTTWREPVKERCPQCNGLLVREKGRKQEFLVCLNKDCGYKRPVERAGGGTGE